MGKKAQKNILILFLVSVYIFVGFTNHIYAADNHSHKDINHIENPSPEIKPYHLIPVWTNNKHLQEKHKDYNISDAMAEQFNICSFEKPAIICISFSSKNRFLFFANQKPRDPPVS